MKWKIQFKIDPRIDFWKQGVIIWLGTEFHNSDCYGKAKNNYFKFDLTIVNCGFKIIIKNNDFRCYGLVK